MDLGALVDDELVQPLRGAIVAEDMVATRQLVESISMQTTKTENLDEVKVYAEDYLLELRDGTQHQSPPNIDDIKTWIEAKGLLLDPYAVLGAILSEGTSWDKQGGSTKLQDVLNDQNIQRIMNIAIDETINEVSKTAWLLR